MTPFPAPQVKPAPQRTYRERFIAGEVQAKPRQRIKPKSARRVREDTVYTKLKREFFAENPYCQVHGCHKPANDLHHKARRGQFFLRVDTWMSACRGHHDQIEQNPTWAKEQGYLLTPEQRRALLNPQPFTLLLPP